MADTRRLRWFKIATSLQALLTPGTFQPVDRNSATRVLLLRSAQALGCSVAFNDTEAVLLKHLLQKANTLKLHKGASRGATVFPFFSSTTVNNTNTVADIEHKLGACLNAIVSLNGGASLPVNRTDWAFDNPKAIMERKLALRASQAN